MTFLERVDNIYAIDTHMWSFDHYMSAYLVVADKIALVDTGQPQQLEAVLKGIEQTGHSVSDIDYIFCGHCEHTDHAGNIAPILRMARKANVYINPVGRDFLLDPNPLIRAKRAQDTPEVAAMRVDMEPVPESRIREVKEGDTFDLGQGEKLTVYITPGHQPSGLVLYEEKNKGLFINDLVGNCFLDAGSHYPLSSVRHDHQQTIEHLKRLMQLPLNYLYMGHYGIADQPYPLMQKSVADLQRLLDMGKECVRTGLADQIVPKMLEMLDPELRKLGQARGEKFYTYARGNHQRIQSQVFADYCVKMFSK